MATPSHIHLIDGKQVAYPNDNCPICGTSKAPAQKEAFIPMVYRKGNTVVTKATRFQMGTVTYWAGKTCFLMSMKKAVRGQDGKLAVTSDKKLIWNQITFRMTKDLLKQFVTELSKLIQDVEGGGNVPQRG